MFLSLSEQAVLATVALRVEWFTGFVVEEGWRSNLRTKSRKLQSSYNAMDQRALTFKLRPHWGVGDTFGQSTRYSIHTANFQRKFCNWQESRIVMLPSREAQRRLETLSKLLLLLLEMLSLSLIRLSYTRSLEGN